MNEERKRREKELGGEIGKIVGRAVVHVAFDFDLDYNEKRDYYYQNLAMSFPYLFKKLNYLVKIKAINRDVNILDTIS